MPLLLLAKQWHAPVQIWPAPGKVAGCQEDLPWTEPQLVPAFSIAVRLPHCGDPPSPQATSKLLQHTSQPH
eukprot:1826962-Amphidinium_carterae.1